MSKSQNSNQDKITVDNILQELSPIFEDTFEELLAKFMDGSNFKRLKRIGEEQFFTATDSNNSIEEESQKIKMQFAEINLLAVSAVNNLDTVIAEKFQGDFQKTLKEEVFKAVQKLDSNQNASESKKSKQPDASQAAENSTKKHNDMIIVLDKLKDMSKYFAQNVNEISKQVIDMPLENTIAEKDIQTILPDIKEEEKDVDVAEENDDIDLGNISFDSASSVHTSDLSSFNDEISISSDEETGQKGKKLSLQMAEERVWNLRDMREKVERESKKKQAEKIKPGDDETSKVSAEDPSTSPSKSLSQRRRKPNSKYSSADIISPLMGKSTEKVASKKSSFHSQESDKTNIQSPKKAIKSTSDQEMETNVPRKRGRPRKNQSLQV